MMPLQAMPGSEHARRMAAQNWLLQAAKHRHTARMEWTEQGVAVLTAGLAWDVVRVPYDVLDPAFDRGTGPAALLRRLDDAQVFGATFCDPYRPLLYVMVAPGTDRHWNRDLARAGVECLGGTRPYVRLVGVPRVERTEPPGPYWLIPPDNAAGLRFADAEHLHQVLTACVQRMTALGTP